MKRVYLLAYPAAHSLSPAMHNAVFEHLGIEGRYEALEVPPERLPEAVQQLRTRDVYGANVTIPHKLAVMALVDELTDAARTVGAVNTIVNVHGRLTGHNTDASGFLRALVEDAHFSPRDKRAVVLGAGGAARAVVYALLTAGVAGLELYNRTPAKGQALAAAFSSLGPVRVLDPERLAERVHGADLLVNTTSVGMEHGGHDPDVSPLPTGLLPYQGLVCDIVYRPARTRLLKDAAVAGLATQNGLPMLVYQGAEAFRTWTGHDAPASVMRAAAEEVLAR
jgi:shikimate dehydrogenase